LIGIVLHSIDLFSQIYNHIVVYHSICFLKYDALVSVVHILADTMCIVLYTICLFLRYLGLDFFSTCSSKEFKSSNHLLARCACRVRKDLQKNL
jgi:hypothetical protein